MTSANTPIRTANSGTPLQTRRLALIVTAGILSFALLSAFWYVVQTQVKRGERIREAQRAGVNVVRADGVVRSGREPSVENDALLANVTLR